MKGEKILPEIVEKLYLLFKEIHEKYPELSDAQMSMLLIREVIPAIYRIVDQEGPLTWRAYMELLNALYDCAVYERMLHEEARKNSQQSQGKSQHQEEN